MTFLDAAEKILKRAGKPLHYKEITQRALARRMIATGGKTPEASMSAQITIHIHKYKNRSKFIRIGRGMFALREVVITPKGGEKSYWMVSTSVRIFSMIVMNSNSKLKVFLPEMPEQSRNLSLATELCTI